MLWYTPAHDRSSACFVRFVSGVMVCPSCCGRFQVITALRIIMGEDGTDIGATKLRALRENSNFMRRFVRGVPKCMYTPVTYFLYF